MGQVLLAGTGQVPARQAATAAGIPMTTPAVVVNKVCLSGLNAIYQADLMIAAGDAEVVVAGGMESMTVGPAPAAGRPAGLSPRRRRHARRPDVRRLGGRPQPRDDGRRHRALPAAVPGRDPRAPGRLRGGLARTGRPGHQGRLLAAEITPVEVPQRTG